MVERRTGEPFARLHADEGRAWLGQPDVQWIDVREPAEWQRGRIPGSVLVPLNRLLLSPRQYLRDGRVVFYCAQGIRSAVACEVAAAVGLTEVFNLEGGIQDWEAQGLPIQR
jgi:rhodanese-related sulfurtransferase